MKISLADDLHLEFDPTFRLYNTENTDVLILAGDICVIDHLNRGDNSPYTLNKMEYTDFFRTCSREWDKVFVVAGNHEYYYGYIDTYPTFYKEYLSQFENITFLNNTSEDYDGVRFVGGTLWTNMDNYNPITEMMIEQYMNDFRIINWQKNYRRFRATDAERLFEETLIRFNDLIDLNTKTVVITHHAPSGLSIHPKYSGDKFNGGYKSDLEDWIRVRPNISLWCHGHVHNPVDYMIDNTRVICNPKGYPNEQGTDFDFKRVYEI